MVSSGERYRPSRAGNRTNPWRPCSGPEPSPAPERRSEAERDRHAHRCDDRLARLTSRAWVLGSVSTIRARRRSAAGPEETKYGRERSLDDEEGDEGRRQRPEEDHGADGDTDGRPRGPREFPNDPV